MFQIARLKLTLWYLAMIMAISLSFSVAIYVFTFSVAQTPYWQLLENPWRDLIQPQLLTTLLILNGLIFILSGILGYLLASRTLKPIKEMLEEQNRFISDSSHELRTPLTSIKSTLEVSLRDKNLTLKEARATLRDSITEVDRLQALTDGLLQLAQYQKPPDKRLYEQVSLTQVIGKAIEQIESQAKQKSIPLIRQINEVKIEGDPQALQRLFVILLDNAIKYSPAGKPIVIAVNNKRQLALVTISDQGLGISGKDLPHIFERFHRADAARAKAATGGYGLGLSIAINIVGAHRGSISVRSKTGSGSTFHISLPIDQSIRLRKPPLFS
jgi:two-component system, OmpR family, sensor histidine kinase CiaH